MVATTLTPTATTYRDYSPTRAVQAFIHCHGLQAIPLSLPNEPPFLRVFFPPHQGHLERAALERLGETRGGVYDAAA
jgi:hypothetical protein